MLAMLFQRLAPTRASPRAQLDMEQDNMMRRLDDQERRLRRLRAELQVIRHDVNALTERGERNDG